MGKILLITKETLTQPQTNARACYQVCALYENGRMAEAVLQADASESILNNIYAARVQNVVLNLAAAFVEIAKGQICYLPLESAKEPLFTKKISKKPLAAGDELAVQVIKEAAGTKDAVVTANLSFPGESLVLTSTDHGIGISSKIKKNDRRRLKTLAQELKGDSPCGIIVRTNAANMPDAQIQAEYLRLKAEYDAFFTSAGCAAVYSCLRRERPFYEKMLLDTDKSNLEEIVTDDPVILKQLEQRFASCRFRLYEDNMLPLAKLYNISGQIEGAFKQRVWLKSGANIIIQPTEALTVIDVNSGKNTSKKDKQQNNFQINLEAAKEIAWQLRLRNISGIIIIDFIDMEDAQYNAALLETLRTYLKQDAVPSRIAGMTKLGLVELTRKKQRKSLAEQL